jgi:coatomer protein complex subunit alpha (xenin)
VVICREYLIGLSLELERRRIATEPESLRRQLELAAYFTHCRLQPAHVALALRLAMTNFTKAKNYPTAATFAQRLLDLSPAPPVATQARKIIATANTNQRDAIEIDYDIHSEFDICPASLTPIYAGKPFVEASFTHARYHNQFKGTLCAVSQITEVGIAASGLKSSI